MTNKHPEETWPLLRRRNVPQVCCLDCNKSTEPSSARCRNLELDSPLTIIPRSFRSERSERKCNPPVLHKSISFETIWHAKISSSSSRRSRPALAAGFPPAKLGLRQCASWN
eukprot:3435269-Rhodomonas_salina.2